MRQLSGQDASFLYLDQPNVDTHGTLLFIYDPATAPSQPVRFKDILADVESRLSISRLFRQKLAHVPLELDYPYWVDDPDFDIEHHVHHVAVPKPGDWRQFCILAARLHAPRMDLSRPLWQMYVVEGLDHVDWLPKGSFAILIKAHHCALDGHTAAELTMGLHDLVPDGSIPVPVKRVSYAPEAMPNPLRLLLNAGVNNARSPWRIAAQALRVLPKLSKTILNFYADTVVHPGEHAITRFNQPISPHRVFTSRGYALAAIKRLRLAVPGATINDAVLSIVAGAIRHYQAAKGELSAAPLRAGMPVNTRRENEFGEAGNNISALFCLAHVNLADPVERLKAVRATTEGAKELSDAIGAREITDISKHSPAAINLLAMKAMNALKWGAGAPFANFIMSNVPGPTVPLYMCGGKMVYWSVIAPLLQAIGLVFAVTSYRDRLFISPTSDRSMLPDPDFFASCIDQSFAEHVAATEALFTQQPQLLLAAAKPQPGRRAHPGLAAMKQLDKAPATDKKTAKITPRKPGKRKPAAPAADGAAPEQDPL